MLQDGVHVERHAEKEAKGYQPVKRQGASGGQRLAVPFVPFGVHAMGRLRRDVAGRHEDLDISFISWSLSSELPPRLAPQFETANSAVQQFLNYKMKQ